MRKELHSCLLCGCTHKWLHRTWARCGLQGLRTQCICLPPRARPCRRRLARSVCYQRHRQAVPRRAAWCLRAARRRCHAPARLPAGRAVCLASYSLVKPRAAMSHRLYTHTPAPCRPSRLRAAGAVVHDEQHAACGHERTQAEDGEQHGRRTAGHARQPRKALLPDAVRERVWPGAGMHAART